MKASNIHGIPLATNNKIVVRHRLYTPTLYSATFQHSIANDTATLQQVLQCYRNLSARSGNTREPIRLLWIGFGAYTAIFLMPMHANTCFEHLLMNDTERFPKLAKFYRQA